MVVLIPDHCLSVFFTKLAVAMAGGIHELLLTCCCLTF